jgi:DGQHR domain-containing protein
VSLQDSNVATIPEDGLTDTKAARITEYKKRRQPYSTKRISQAELEEHLAAGWELDREMQRGVRVRRSKSLDEQLENQLWVLLYLLGYEKLNTGRHFKISVDVEGKKISKQIDVLALDDETAVVAECKSAETMKSKSLQAEISEFDSIKKQVANAIRAHGGAGYKPKIIWLMVTARIRWKENDLARAKDRQIHVVREHELRYFMEIAKILGRAAKYQFHSEFLRGQSIPALSQNYVPASRFKLGGRAAYSFTISAVDLLRRAFVNHRDLRDPSGAPTYQRLINPGRLKKIAGFLEGGGYFANSVLVNFHHDLRFDISDRDPGADTQFGRLYLPDTYKSCWIIDGQHRIYGAAVVNDPARAPAIPVVAFERLPAEEEANLFATINREQKQVQKKLLDELDGELKWGSDDPREAISAIAVRALDMLRGEVLGPFEDRIALPGMRGRQQPLTVPQLKPAILQSALIGRISARDGRFVPGPLTGSTHEETLANLTSFLGTFFESIRRANPDRWAGTSVPLCHNTAVAALIRLASELVRHLETVERLDVHELDPSDLADQIELLARPFIDFCQCASDEEFKVRFPITFGTGGPKRYFLQAAALIAESTPSLKVEGLDEFRLNSSKGRTDQGDQAVRWIVDNLHRYVVSRLREIYGSDFFEKGIKSKDIKIKAYSKRADTDPDGSTPLENYLDVIELKKIVESSENWPHFKDTLSIPMPGQQKGLAKYIKWMDDFNDVRKIYAHPFNRSYSDSDMELLTLIEGELRSRSSNG